MYIFGISCATIGLVAIETIAYFSKSLHPAFCIVVNIALFLGWCGCLAVYFVWGGGLEYTGAAWISQYNSFCNLGNPPVADSVEYIYTVTCGGEKILLIMLPFVCLNMYVRHTFYLSFFLSLLQSQHSLLPGSANQVKPSILQKPLFPFTLSSPDIFWHIIDSALHVLFLSLLYPIFTIFVLVTAILHYSRKGRPGYPQQSGPTAPPSHPAYGMAPQQQQAVPMQGENARFSANQSSMSPTTTMTTTTPPQPFVHQGVLYQPIAIAQPGYGQSPMELSGHAAPMREMAGQGVKVDLGSEGVDQKGDAYQKE